MVPAAWAAQQPQRPPGWGPQVNFSAAATGDSQIIPPGEDGISQSRSAKDKLRGTRQGTFYALQVDFYAQLSLLRTISSPCTIGKPPALQAARGPRFAATFFNPRTIHLPQFDRSGGSERSSGRCLRATGQLSTPLWEGGTFLSAVAPN